jgi:transposase
MVKQKQYTMDLKEAEWQVFEPCLLRLMPARRRGRKTSYQLRVLLNAMRYVLRSGCTWRDLPGDFPSLAKRLLPLRQVASSRVVAQAK